MSDGVFLFLLLALACGLYCFKKCAAVAFRNEHVRGRVGRAFLNQLKKRM